MDTHDKHGPPLEWAHEPLTRADASARSKNSVFPCKPVQQRSMAPETREGEMGKWLEELAATTPKPKTDEAPAKGCIIF